LSTNNDLVLDASPIMSYLFTEENHDKIYHILRTTIERGYRLVTAELAYKEVANALLRACALRNLINEEDMINSLNSLYKLPIEPIRQDKGLILRTLRISLESKLAVYDTIYIALAEKEKADLLTSDRKQYTQAIKYVNASLV